MAVHREKGWGRQGAAPFDSDIIGSTEPDAIGLGRLRDWVTGRIGPRLRFENRGEGILLIGRNAAGKDSRILVNQLLQSSGLSYFILDVKGELSAICAQYRRTLGPVFIINAFGMLIQGDTYAPGYEDLKSDGFNPLRQLNSKSRSFVNEVGYIASAIITQDASGNGNAAHFINSARALVKLAIMIEVIRAEIEKRVPTMANVRELICTPTGYDPLAKQDFGWPDLARKVLRSDNKAMRNLASQFTVYNNEVSSILSEAKQQTESFDVTEIAEDMALPGFDMTEMKRKPVTVFVIMPPLEIPEQFRYLRLLIDTALRAVMRPCKPGEPKCVFMLNEFATIGKLETLRRVWGVVRGFGITLMPVLQSLNQLISTYGKDDTATFLGQAGVISSFGAADQETAEWLSKRCGTTTAVVAGFSENQQTQGIGGNEGLSFSQARVPTVTPHETFGLHDGQMIHFAAGMSDFISGYAPPYWRVQECAARARPNPYYQPRQPAPGGAL